MSGQMRLALSAVLALLPMHASCALFIPPSYASPGEITIADALKQTACGLGAFRDELRVQKVRSGTIVDSIDVEFNVKASAKGNSDLVLDSSKSTIPIISALGINYSDKSELYGEKTNKVVLKFKSLHTADLNDPGKKAAAESGIGISADTSDQVPEEIGCGETTFVKVNYFPEERIKNDPFEQILKSENVRIWQVAEKRIIPYYEYHCSEIGGKAIINYLKDPNSLPLVVKKRDCSLPYDLIAWERYKKEHGTTSQFNLPIQIEIKGLTDGEEKTIPLDEVTAPGAK